MGSLKNPWKTPPTMSGESQKGAVAAASIPAGQVWAGAQAGLLWHHLLLPMGVQSHSCMYTIPYCSPDMSPIQLQKAASNAITPPIEST